jgi:hypothetical protein
MGHRPGKGLGLKGQGITAPVEPSKQRGRRGLGLIIEGLEDGRVEWDPSLEHIEIHEKVQWMKKSELDCPGMDGNEMKLVVLRKLFMNNNFRAEDLARGRQAERNS